MNGQPALGRREGVIGIETSAESCRSAQRGRGIALSIESTKELQMIPAREARRIFLTLA